MAFMRHANGPKGRRPEGKKGNDKYLRLTGLWVSKDNDRLMTGRVKAEELPELVRRCKIAIDTAVPMVCSIWENDRKESKRDPDVNLNCFVGDVEEEPRATRPSRFSEAREDETAAPPRWQKPEPEEEDSNEDEVAEEKTPPKKKQVDW